MTATPTEKARYCEWFLREALPRIDPTVTDRVMVFDAGVLPDWSNHQNMPAGFTSLKLPYELRNAIESRGLRPESTDFITILDGKQISSELHAEAIGLHELAHHIVERDLARRLFSVLETEFLLGKASEAAYLANRVLEEMNDEGTLPWEQHGEDFIRIASHFVQRARSRFGWLLTIDDVIQPHSYLLERASTYRDHLGSEPDDLAHLPLARVLHVPAPESFRQFAERDLADATTQWQFLTTPLSTEYAMSLLDQFRSRRETKKSDRWSEYAAILARNKKPKAGDADRLADLVAALEINPSAVEVHLAILSEASALTARLEKLKALQAEDLRLEEDRQTLSDAFLPVLREYQKNINAIDKQREPIRHQLATLPGETETLDAMQKRFAKLLRTEPGPCAANQGITREIRNMMNAMGLTEDDITP